MSKDAVDPKRDAASLSSSTTTTTLFSKATSQFNRSPSKKGKASNLTTPYLQRPFAKSAENELDRVSTAGSRPPSRPGYQRNFTAPVSTNVEKKTPLNTGTAAKGPSPLGPVDTAGIMNGPSVRKDSGPKSATATHAPVDFSGIGLVAGLPTSTSIAPAGSQNPSILYQHIHDIASKRISTLDYLRKAHEGRVYWFNTIHFSKTDLSRLSSFQPAKLARRATNYMLLGLSIPTILDVYTANANSPYEFLRALNTLLGEFESFQQLHPPDGSTSSSMSRARIPQMFKRSTNTSKARRASSAASEIGLPFQASSSTSIDTPSIISGPSAVILEDSTPQSTTSTIPTSSFFDPSTGQTSGEEYTHLLTPSLPFDPDFYETFATLCDVLIDAYTRVISLVSTPSVCTAALGEMFTKADARLRKVIVGGVVREFEEASRSTAKSEVAGVGRVVLGGLMAQ